jgi:hypothetical protein
MKITRIIVLVLASALVAPAFAAPRQSRDQSAAQTEYSAAAESVYRATHFDMGN